MTFALNQINISGQLVPVVTQPIEDIAASSTKKTAKGAAMQTTQRSGVARLDA